MAKYKIKYNPYRNYSVISKNGNTLPTNCKLRKTIEGKRLQEWFDSAPGWEGFANEINKDNNDKTCEIEFIGREIDFIDLQDSFNNIHANTQFTLTLTPTVSESDMLAKLEVLVSELDKYEAVTKQQKSEMLEHIRTLKEDPFTISVIATMSSGKSTLLNSFLRTRLLPTGDDATTANIVEITDNDISGEFDLIGLDKHGNTVFNKKNGTGEDIQKINKDSSIHTLKIAGDVPMVSVGKMKLMLRDTPGPNNSQSADHRRITESVIHDTKNMSTVLYVMNATNLRDDCEKDLLENIALALKNANQQIRDRFFFVINKADLRIFNPEQTLSTLINETRDYLYNDFGIENPRIFPISAGLASGIYELRGNAPIDIIRQKGINDTIGYFVLDDDRVKLEKYASSSQYVKKQINGLLRTAEDKKDQQEIALLHSGLPSLEYSIKEYMEKYAYPIKVSEAVKDIVATIDQKEMELKFYNIITKDHVQLDKVRDQIKRIMSKKSEREERRDAFTKKIDAYQFNESIAECAKEKIDKQFMEKADAFGKAIDKNKLEKEFAQKKVTELQKAFVDIEETVHKELSSSLRDDIFKKCNDVLKEYKDYIDSLNENLGTINGFNFGAVKEFRTSFETINNAAATVKFTEDETISYWVDDYFIDWGPIRLFKTGSHKTTTKTGRKIEYVDKASIKESVLKIKADARDAIDNICADSKNEFEQFKLYYHNQLEKLSKSIDAIISELSENTTEESIAKKQMENHEKQLASIKEIISQIESITDIA